MIQIYISGDIVCAINMTFLVANQVYSPLHVITIRIESTIIFAYTYEVVQKKEFCLLINK